MSALGASLLANGVTFRVWAPRCRSVDVVVDGRAIEALVPRDGGVFDVMLEGLAEGARYKYRLDATRYRPDPASRFQPEGVHGPSVVVDPNRFVWTDQEFAGHALGDLVLYELHVGAFTPPGTFEAEDNIPFGRQPRFRGSFNRRPKIAGRSFSGPEHPSIFRNTKSRNGAHPDSMTTLA